jgi:hypothetical protein
MPPVTWLALCMSNGYYEQSLALREKHHLKRIARQSAVAAASIGAWETLRCCDNFFQRFIDCFHKA